MSERKGKRTLIALSDDDDVVSISSDSCSDWSGEKEQRESDDQEESDDNDVDEIDGDDEFLSNKVTRLLQEGNDLQALNLKECKAYLRKHGLRITGTKAVCIQRIKEHCRIKDGNGEALYPRSSFVINCTGDVCKGDVVLFTQKVYERFDKVTRTGCLLGKRTIAGRVVKESYGVAKQQHTFTVEILWSKGIKQLPPLFPLLVKGRNLYKLKTFRQCWNNETERLRVLAEKHKRGARARLVRGQKRKKKAQFSNGGAKRRKHSHDAGPSQRKQIHKPEEWKHADGTRTIPSLLHAKSNNLHQKAPPNRLGNSKQITKSIAPTYSQMNHKLTPYHKDGVSTFQSLYNPPQKFHQTQFESYHKDAPFHFCSSNDMSHTSTTVRGTPFRPHTDSSMRWLPLGPYIDPYMIPATRCQGFNHSNYSYHSYSNPSHQFEPGINHNPELMNIDRPIYPFGRGTETYGQRKYRFGGGLH